MAAYLFTWNPAKFEWEANYPGGIAELSRAGKTDSRFPWSCSRSTKPQRDDRAFLIKLGQQGRGVFASGWIMQGSHDSEEPEFGPLGVLLELTMFLDPTIDANLLDPTDIKVGNQYWTPQSSGTTIRAEALSVLEVRWSQHLEKLGKSPGPRRISKTDAAVSFELEALEGEESVRMVRHRHRERALRDQKILEVRAKYGNLACEACAFDFDRAYGVKYAEVHHLKPLASNEKEILNKTSDLAVLCANCHRVAHHNAKKVMAVSEIRALLARKPAKRLRT